MKVIALVFIVLLAGCGGCSNTQYLEDTVGVGPDDNAIMCVSGRVPGTFTGTELYYKRLEFPSGFDLSTMTAEQIDNLESRLCD